MNESYLLKDLISFWQRQMKDNFTVIEALVNLVEYQSENLPNPEKVKVILETLRKYGLYEVGYKGDRTTFLKNITPIPKAEKKPEEDIVWDQKPLETRMELYNIRLLNATVEFVNFMN